MRLIVPVAAGGPTDIVARILAEKLATMWRQQVFIENKSGAGNNIGIEHVARSDPDGYTTILFDPGSIAANTSLYRTLSYDAIVDFAPVSLVAKVDYFMFVPNSSPAHSVKEFIDYVRSRPGQLTMASPGTGSAPYLAEMLFLEMADIRMTHVPYSCALRKMLGPRELWVRCRRVSLHGRRPEVDRAVKHLIDTTDFWDIRSTRLAPIVGYLRESTAGLKHWNDYQDHLAALAIGVENARGWRIMLRRYSSRRASLHEEFLQKRLAGATRYERIAGYFQSSLLDLANARSADDRSGVQDGYTAKILRQVRGPRALALI